MENLFRYMAIRNPQRLKSTATIVRIDVQEGNRSAYHQQLVQLRADGAARAAFEKVSALYQQGEAFAEPVVGAFAALQQLGDELGDDPVGKELVLVSAAELLGSPGGGADAVRDALDGPSGRETWRRLVDATLSVHFVPVRAPYAPDELIRGLKQLHLLRLAVDDQWPFAADHRFELLLERLVPVVSSDVFHVRDERPMPKPVITPIEEPEEIKQAKARIRTLEGSLQELTEPRVLNDLEAREPISFRGGNTSSRSFGSLFGFGVDEPDEGEVPDLALAAPSVRLKPTAFDGLSEKTHDTLATYGYSREDTDVVNAVRLIKDDLARLKSQTAPPRQYSVLVGNMHIAVSEQEPQPTQPFDPVIDPAVLLPVSCVHYAGQGELRIVRQKLKAYELGDIAHIENVFAGEKKERTHRRLDRREEMEREETEAETQSDRDLQSTERHELETEAEKMAATAAHVEGALTVSGSYGPTVSFTANASAGYSYQSESASRRASRFAHEVVDRTVERIKERTLRERRTIRIHEIEETNFHGVDNDVPDAQHVRGVYRWLNKIYNVGIYSYGMRHMFEFMVPQPAAFYLWSLGHSQAQMMPTDSPTKPEFNVDETDWQLLAADYGAQGVQPPPPNITYVGYAADVTGTEVAHHTKSHVMKVPDGYEAFAAVCNVARTSRGGSQPDAGWRLLVHNYAIAGGKEDKAEIIWFTGKVGGEVPIGFRDWGNRTYVFAVNLMCIRTEAHYQKWRYDTFTAILEAYRDAETDFQARLAQAEIGEGIQIPGRNPAENRRIIRDELIRGCLSLFTGTTLEHYNGFQQTGWYGEWRLDPARALHDGAEALFFQNAFEWENMTYVFYPYYYGRAHHWASVLHQYGDPDPNLEAFIKSGMARVQVPVRPGFEGVIARYCQSEEPWAGDDAPLIGDDLYVPIIDEIKRELEAPDEPQLIGETWETRVPTSLVLLEDAANLVGFRDPLFGGENGLSGIEFGSSAD